MKRKKQIKTNKNKKRSIIIVLISLILIIPFIFFFLTNLDNTFSIKMQLKTQLNNCLKGEQEVNEASNIETIYLYNNCISVLERNKNGCNNNKECNLWVLFAEILDSNEVDRCEELNDPPLKRACNGVFNQDSSSCLNSDEVKSCELFINKINEGISFKQADLACTFSDKLLNSYCGGVSKDITYCEELKYSHCYNTYYYEMAKLTRDSSFCGQIIGREDIKNCFEYYINSLTNLTTNTTFIINITY